MPDPANTREIIITGAHRSGTSAISHFLANLGVDVGDPRMLLEQAQDNPKGFFERLDVLSLNDAILHCANSTWDRPDMRILSEQHELTVTDDIPLRIKALLDSFQNGNRPFLLKDPRFSLTLPVWVKHFSHPLVIICLRNPLEIARSLQKRNGFSIYKGLAIWEAYVCRLMVNCRNLSCLRVNFNRILGDPLQYGTRLAERLADCGVEIVSPVSEAVTASFDAKLKHEEYLDSDLERLLSVRQMELWRCLDQESDISRLAQRNWSFNNFEGLRQKDTDIGYSRLEIKLFADPGDSGLDSYETTLLVGRNERFTFQLNRSGVQSFRLAPLNRSCVIKYLSFEVVSLNGQKQKLAPSRTNGFFDPATSHFYFPQENPVIYYSSPFKDIKRVVVELLFVTLEVEATRQLIIDYFILKGKDGQGKLLGATSGSTADSPTEPYADPRKEIPRMMGFLRRILSVYHLAKMASRPGELVNFLRYYRVIAKEPSLFSPDFYLQQNTDVISSTISPLIHFFIFGWKERRDPSPDFDVSFYLETYKDVAQQGINPLLHYLDKGWKEGRNPSTTFDTNAYIGAHPEILSKQINPLVHKEAKKQNPSAPQKDAPSLQFDKRSPELSKSVTVILPVYLSNDEAVRTLQLLIDSLAASYPIPGENLRFLVIDDASPITSCRSILDERGFTDRADVNYCENQQNLGFTRTVNEAVKQASGKSDIVLLNSDTEIYGPVFEILQRACYRRPHIATVTPLSNRATIASLINWPYGTDAIYSCSPEEVSATVEKLGLVGPVTGPPTGHGFCMYMSRAAIKDIGLFDEETFAQGYGEENDWSMRAIIAGYSHHICTECFVFHHESKSFSPDQKSGLQKENTRKLNERYPYYAAMVQNYISNDPLRHHRTALQFFLLGKKKGVHTILYIIHDSFNNHEGGVQQHVKQLINSLIQLGRFELIVLSPSSFKGESYEIHLFQENEAIHLAHLEQGFLAEILQHLGDRIDFLHVHHTHGLLKLMTDWIKNVKAPKKILTIHDYDFFCVNPFLLNDDGIFCLSQDNRGRCENRACESKDRRDNSLLPFFDIIFVPSDNCRRYVKTIADDPVIVNKLRLLPHFLPFIDEIDSSEAWTGNESVHSNNIIFLGSLYPHKGGELFLESLELLYTGGYQPYVWGQAQESLLSKYTDVPKILSYRNWRELLELYQNYGAHIVVIPAVCAETFSYTLYEALFLFEVPVVVGPYGNPAEIVKQHGVGEVLSSLTPANLAEAVTNISKNYSDYQKSVRQYKCRCHSEFTQKRYLEHYIREVTGTDTPQAGVIYPENYPAPIILTDSGKALLNRALQQKGNTALRVLVIHTLSKKDPPFFFRVETPLQYLEKSGSRVDTYHIDNIPLQPDDCDLIYLSRTPLTDKLAILLNNAKARGIPTVLDVDDLVFHSDFLEHFYFLDKTSPEINRYRRLLDNIEKTFQEVDILLGSTPGIAAMGTKYGKTSIYFRNMLRFSQLELYQELFETRPRHKEFQIGYFAGSSTHDKDFELLIPVLEQIFHKWPETRLLLMGFLRENAFLEEFSENISREPFESYDKYLRALQRCKVVAVPVAEMNPFSNAKSNIKFLEAAAVGTPIIASPINEMRYCIEHGVTGWLANNTQTWVQCLETALNEGNAEYIGKHAHAEVFERFRDGSQSFCNLLTAITNPRH